MDTVTFQPPPRCSKRGCKTPGSPEARQCPEEEARGEVFRCTCCPGCRAECEAEVADG